MTVAALLATTLLLLLAYRYRVLRQHNKEVAEAYSHAICTIRHLTHTADTLTIRAVDAVTTLELVSRALGHSLNGRRVDAIAILQEVVVTEHTIE